jgi:apolipoprotein D and lipocalin family protein
VIANIPYSAENGKVGSYVEYLKRDDGRMDDLYFFRKKNFERKVQRWEGVAWIPDPAQPTRWKAQFVWPLTFDYFILDVAPDYSWAMVGHPGRDLAWIFARTPSMDDALYQSLLQKFSALEYDATRLERVAQFPQDLGKPGYQMP